MPQLIFGGILATILLGFYIWSIVDGVSIAMKCSLDANCTKQFSANMSFLLNSLGGLISATVVGVLGATERGEYPGIKAFKGDLRGAFGAVAAFMPSFYILVWIICGVVIVIYGFILRPDAVEPLSAQAKVWLGTAIAAVYAYFGINPNGKRD